MNATYIPQETESLKMTILESIRHKTLLKYIETPSLNDHQLFYLLLPKLNGEQWDDNTTIAATTVGIVHASLAEHDKIKALNATSKSQQLTVLSGDYYSGRYYEILAHANNIPLIHKISEGIVSRCEQEITVYHYENRSLSDWINSLAIIDTVLIQRFYEVYQYDVYIPIMKEALTIQRLKHEIALTEAGQQTLFSLMMQKSIGSASFPDTIQHEIKSRTDKLQELVEASSLEEALKQAILQRVS
ncbi:heptaprenyl diphosphate synthase component 1 [Lysinibacillus sp. 54212]|uniref:heptaprenyl diphosphate synthase component 1 n=1 Tax=Lysinibacillus sp. 54212 TaxID=3119829 RepID=UPI002FC7C2C5